MVSAKKVRESFFSIKNDERKTHKVVNILGCKIKFKKNKINLIKNAVENYQIMHNPSLYIGIPDDITLQLMFNNDCNCRCKFCSANNQTRQTRKMIPEDILYKYLEPIYKKTKSIVPTYGELTCCKEGYDYLSYINDNYPEINLFLESNGIAFNKRWFKLAADSLMTIKFSINAVDEESFKRTVWEKDGVYTVIKNNIENYLEYLKERDLFVFKPSISSVLNSSNYHLVREFIKTGLNWKLQKFGFYFDTRENKKNNIYNVKDKEGFDKAVMTLLELEKLLKGKVYFYFRLYMPVKLEPYEKIVNDINLDSLKEKYSDIWNLVKDYDDYTEIYRKKTEIRKKHNKKLLTFFEELEGTCWHKREYKGIMICENPWNHIRLQPDGRMSVCAWRGYQKSYNIRNFINKKDKLDFDLLFNDLQRRTLRKKYTNPNCTYEGCMENCVSAKAVSKQEFDERYNLSECSYGGNEPAASTAKNHIEQCGEE